MLRRAAIILRRALHPPLRHSTIQTKFPSQNICRKKPARTWHVQVRGSLTQAAQQHEEGSEGASSGQGAATGGRGTGADPCLVQGQGGVLGGVRAMGDAAGDPGGGHGVYHQHLKQDVDDRSISAPPVLELTAKVMAGAC